MKTMEAVEVVKNHFADQSWVDPDIDDALAVLNDAARTLAQLQKAWALGLDVELMDNGRYVRLWREGDMVAECSGKLMQPADRIEIALEKVGRG